MKKTLVYSLIAIPIALIVFLIACKKTDSSHAGASKTYAEVRSWYENRLQSIYPQLDSKIMSGEVQPKTVMWDAGKTFESDSTTIYQFPFSSKKRRAYDITTSNQSSVIPLDMDELHSYRYIVFTKYKNGNFTCAVMTIKGGSDYMQKHNNNLLGNDYLHLKEDFTGDVIFHTLADEFLGGWRYNEGKVVNKLKIPRNLPNASTSCSTWLLTEYCQDCTDYYTNGEYTHSTCGSLYGCESSTVTICTETQGEPGSGGPGVPPGAYGPWTPRDGIMEVLCPTNDFKPKLVAAGYTMAIEGLGVAFYHPTKGPRIFNFEKFCVVIPKFGTSSPLVASEVFREAYNQAVKQTVQNLNDGMLDTPFVIQDQFLENIRLNLVAMKGTNAIFSKGSQTCPGVPVVQVKYGTDCR